MIKNNELNLCEILKDCPKGTKLYSTVYGDVYLKEIISDCGVPIILEAPCFPDIAVYPDGRFYDIEGTECIIFPSKDNRDWSTFKPKVEHFDPKMLKPFDKVLVRDNSDGEWSINLFSRIVDEEFRFDCLNGFWRYCIPYNNDTEHLLGTTKEAPEYYKYWL